MELMLHLSLFANWKYAGIVQKPNQPYQSILCHSKIFIHTVLRSVDKNILPTCLLWQINIIFILNYIKL